MLRLAEPHAGALVNRFAEDEEMEALRARAARLPRLTLGSRELADLELVATGAASPLTGFMGHRDYRSVLERLRLADGTPWPVPFTLPVTVADMATALQHRAAALWDASGTLRALIDVSDAFVRDPREEARALYGTGRPTHRGVRHLLSRPTGTLGGRITVVPAAGGGEAELVPRDVRATARRERWAGLRAVAATDGAGCLEPIGGAAPALLAVPRVAVRRAPGRDAFLQAIVLKNFGAREIVFEYDRADWLAVSPDLAPENLGIAPVWALGVGQRPRETVSVR